MFPGRQSLWDKNIEVWDELEREITHLSGKKRGWDHVRVLGIELLNGVNGKERPTKTD